MAIGNVIDQTQMWIYFTLNTFEIFFRKHRSPEHKGPTQVYGWCVLQYQIKKKNVLVFAHIF